LAPFAELWVGPEFFNILDSAQLYQHEPELLVLPDTDKAAIAAMPEVLRHWTRLRDEAGGSLYWVGDALRESSIPDAVDQSVVPRWEAASRTLDLCLPQSFEVMGRPVSAAIRDAAALCAVLTDARIIGHGGQGKPPPICAQLEQWGLTCEQLSVEDALISVERSEFLRLILEAGLAPSIWDGLQLALVYLWLPNSGRLDQEPAFRHEDEAAMLVDEDEVSVLGNPWEGAKCFYSVITKAAGRASGGAGRCVRT
jgi:hypothetical protein